MINAGLILEGGAARGIFTAGVLDYMMEQDVWLEYVCGVSAGACNAVDYISKQPGRSKDAIIPKDRSYRMAKLSALPEQHSLLDMEMLFDRFPNELIPFDYETYFASHIKCDLVVTNALTGTAEYMDERQDRVKLMDILRASSSIPVASPMTILDGTPYVDGGVADAIPIIHSMKRGYRKNIVILTRREGYVKEEPSESLKAVYRIAYRKYPELLKVLMTRHHTYNITTEVLKKWEDEGRIFVIRPEMKEVGRLESDPERLEEFYRHGYEVMKGRVEEMMEYIGRV